MVIFCDDAAISNDLDEIYTMIPVLDQMDVSDVDPSVS